MLLHVNYDYIFTEEDLTDAKIVIIVVVTLTILHVNR